MFRAPATFGQQVPGCKYRQNQCYTLDAADLLVVDYDQNEAFTHFRRHRLKHQLRDNICVNRFISLSFWLLLRGHS